MVFYFLQHSTVRRRHELLIKRSVLHIRCRPTGKQVARLYELAGLTHSGIAGQVHSKRVLEQRSSALLRLHRPQARKQPC